MTALPVFSGSRATSAKTRATPCRPNDRPATRACCEVEMRQSCGKFGQLSGPARARLVDFLRREHPAKTADCVYATIAAHGYDGSIHAVGKWFERASSPNFSACCALIAAYGPRLLACILGSGFSWLDEACVAASRKEFAGQVERLRQKFEIE